MTTANFGTEFGLQTRNAKPLLYAGVCALLHLQNLDRFLELCIVLKINTLTEFFFKKYFWSKLHKVVGLYADTMNRYFVISYKIFGCRQREAAFAFQWHYCLHSSFAKGSNAHQGLPMITHKSC